MATLRQQAEEYIAEQVYSNSNHEVSAQNIRNSHAKNLDYTDAKVKEVADNLTTTNSQLATIGTKVGELSGLNTTAKDNIINAINEVASKEVDAYSKTQSDARYASQSALFSENTSTPTIKATYAEKYADDGTAASAASGYNSYAFDAKQGDKFTVTPASTFSKSTNIASAWKNGAFVSIILNHKPVAGTAYSFIVSVDCDEVRIYEKSTSTYSKTTYSSKLGVIDSSISTLNTNVANRYTKSESDARYATSSDIASVRSEVFTETEKSIIATASYDYRYADDGTAETATANFKSYAYTAKQGDVFKVTPTYTFSKTSNIATAWKNGTFVSVVLKHRPISGTAYTFSVDADCDEVRIYERVSSTIVKLETSSKFETLSDTLDDVIEEQQNIAPIASAFTFEYVYEQPKEEKNEYYDSAGNATEYSVSGYSNQCFDAKKGDKFKIEENKTFSNTRNIVTAWKNSVFVGVLRSGKPVAGDVVEIVINADCDEVRILEGEGTKIYRYKAVSNGSQKRTIKVLTVGNSFAQDAFSYVPFIWRNLGIDVDIEFGVMFDGGMSLENWYNAFVNGTSKTLYRVVNGKWKNFSRSLSSAISETDWDIITFQQVSGSSATYSSISPYLGNLIKGIYPILKKPARIGWHITPAKQTDFAASVTFFEGIADVAENVVKDYPIDFVLPSGTALQNMRTTSLRESVVSQDGNFVYSAHLQEGLPCLVEAYSAVVAILRASGLGNISIMGDKTRPTQEWITEKNIMGQHGTSIGITDDNCRIAQICAIKAVQNPFAITNCSAME